MRGGWLHIFLASACGILAFTALCHAHDMDDRMEWSMFGMPGKTTAVTRTVAIGAGDMRYSLKALEVKRVRRSGSSSPIRDPASTNS